ncbi:MAG: hypothetical protein AAF597_14575, partial [Bacteroidota bacterium]
VVVDPPANPMPTIGFLPGPYYTGCPIDITLSAIDGATLMGTWSDGSTQNTSGSRSFDVPGSYTLALEATIDGRTEEVQRTFTVIEQETFSEVFQQDDDFTRLHKLLPLANGGFVGYGDYCSTVRSDGTCRVQGFLVVWYNADGTIRTKRAFSGNATTGIGFWARAITPTADGNVAVAYERVPPNGDGLIEGCLMKLPEVGNVMWNASLTATWDVHPRALLETSDGKFVMGGYARRQENPITRAGMYFFQADGTHIENIPFGELTADARIERLVEKAPGEIIGTMVFGNSMRLANALNRSVSDLQLGGYTPSNLLKINGGESLVISTNGQQVSVLRLGASGQVADRRTISLSNVFLYNATLLDNGNILISGKQRDSGTDYGYLAEITPQAELVWEKRRTRAHSLFRGAQPTDDCGIFAVGFTNRPANNNGNNEGYYIKLKPRGEL